MRAGESRRAVAHGVFGDERLKGRVDRIVREDALGGRRGDVQRLLNTIAHEAQVVALTAMSPRWRICFRSTPARSSAGWRMRTSG